ncbi:hypothetical protein OSB04_029969 [Centaurea solstitialis]|uniref:Vacuolar-processing enzyme n=1 Tax=Centaurea solstitialis TaxID=347529 RepID=A0AA38SIY0_9ASTR|nr:hypothetical protein OSB04_029969 [Centaurea solstitialis]
MKPYAILLLLALSIAGFVHGRLTFDDFIRLPSEKPHSDDLVGTRWAVLLAGSNGYWNYRHQADVCHAYQILKKGGLKDENIVVFMYDDIANNEENPGLESLLITQMADYTGEDVTVDNFFAVLLGNKTAVRGGSGKVVNSGMPTNPYMYANDLIEVLKKKHASGTYKSLVFYLEACESGSIFEGLLPVGLNIYATTASGPDENSWGTYCPGDSPSAPPEYDTCLGDLYSVAWMEDSEAHNLQTETIRQQYYQVKERTSNGNSNYGSHVMQYGDLQLSMEELYLYLGTNPANDNLTFVNSNSLQPSSTAVNQRDADLLHFWHKYRKAPEGSSRKTESGKQFAEAMTHRMHIDSSYKTGGEGFVWNGEGCGGPEWCPTCRPTASEEFRDTLRIPITVWYETHAFVSQLLQCRNQQGTDDGGIFASMPKLSIEFLELAYQRFQRLENDLD